MKFNKFIVQVIFASLIPLTLFSQNNSENKDYVPHQGQAGKDVIWVPTPKSLVQAMLDKANVGPGDFLVDLGSGDGRIVIEAAKRGAKAIGIEYNPDMVKLSEEAAKREGVANKAKFYKMDLFEYDFSEATVVSMYLLSELNLRLRPKLLEMKPGTRIVSNTFNLGAWQSDAEIYADSSIDNNPDKDDSAHNWDWIAYYWVVPAKVEGTWKFKDGNLILEQKFQLFHGNYTFDGKSVRVVNGKLTGNEITFLIDGVTYTGNVKNKKMTGISTDGISNKNWEASLISQ
jgi:precorrin-6B methylase 2